MFSSINLDVMQYLYRQNYVQSIVNCIINLFYRSGSSDFIKIWRFGQTSDWNQR